MGLKGDREKIQIRAGGCGAYAEQKGMDNVAEYDAGEPYSVLSIDVAPSALADIFGLDDESPPQLPRTHGHPRGGMFTIHFARTRRSIANALSDIINPPMEGRFLPIFAECKVIEVISLMLNDIHAGNQGCGRPSSLTTAEVARLYNVRDLLNASTSDPPPLIQLAHDHGFTHNKLNKGFRELFGSTVYEYVRAIRLEKAREMLLSGDRNVTEACYGVGYSNISHFAKIYRQQYGESPSRSRKRYFIVD